MHQLGLSHRATFRKSYLYPAAVGLIEMTDPESQRSPKQQYRRVAR
ncbi:Fic family protein [Pseudomonas inefficax]